MKDVRVEGERMAVADLRQGRGSRDVEGTELGPVGFGFERVGS